MMEKIMENTQHLFIGLREVLDLKNNITEIISLARLTVIMMVLMLLGEIGAFIFGGDYGFMSWLGLITGIATVLNLILVDQGRITNYSWGILSCIVWLIVAVYNHLIGDIASQTFYLVMQFVGITVWHKQMAVQNNKTELKARKMKKWQAILAFIGAIILYFIVLETSKRLNGTQVYVDATLLPLGIIGMILMTYGYRSQWIAWLILDVINIYIWSVQLTNGGPAALSMFVLQIIMFINSVYGAYMWFSPVKQNEAQKAS
ncbi:nicotinamide riboside transporter PnuC [Ligilactobacillus sp. WILCCON 0076]|uniref:Nicotinamide riboside transporter PnuC n=1 Tax=Ligilactobacillus ubinensis TaxID=2876789 RepID=A0A9X2JLD5_9LACO|nr:nicotinamide riboside transporter PnuC [Ligilactobacillus ubinensis]MCP0886799.1 nicotinamide riboside transporter PnuC [Ligilactobacillus ubinensis]